MLWLELHDVYIRHLFIQMEYHAAFPECRLLILDKDPGVRPIGIGEVRRRITLRIHP